MTTFNFNFDPQGYELMIPKKRGHKVWYFNHPTWAMLEDTQDLYDYAEPGSLRQQLIPLQRISQGDIGNLDHDEIDYLTEFVREKMGFQFVDRDGEIVIIYDRSNAFTLADVGEAMVAMSGDRCDESLYKLPIYKWVRRFDAFKARMQTINNQLNSGNS